MSKPKFEKDDQVIILDDVLPGTWVVETREFKPSCGWWYRLHDIDRRYEFVYLPEEKLDKVRVSQAKFKQFARVRSFLSGMGFAGLWIVQEIYEDARGRRYRLESASNKNNGAILPEESLYLDSGSDPYSSIQEIKEKLDIISKQLADAVPRVNKEPKEQQKPDRILVPENIKVYAFGHPQVCQLLLGSPNGKMILGQSHGIPSAGVRIISGWLRPEGRKAYLAPCKREDLKPGDIALWSYGYDFDLELVSIEHYCVILDNNHHARWGREADMLICRDSFKNTWYKVIFE